MKKSDSKKQALLEKLAPYIMMHGVQSASLRPMAKHAETSDRMLIYHFGTKEALIGELLQFIADQVTEQLQAALPPEKPKSQKDALTEIVTLLRTPPMRIFMSLWFEVLSIAGKGQDRYRDIGRQIISGFLDWVESRLPDSESDPANSRALLLTLIEGITVMDFLDHGETADRAIETLFRNYR